MPYTQTFKEDFYIPGHVSVTPGELSNPHLAEIRQPIVGSRTGQRVDNWKEKIRDGISASSPYTSNRTRVEHVRPGFFSASFTDRKIPVTRLPAYASYAGLQFHFGVNLNPTHEYVDSSIANSAALTKIYKKIESEYQHLNSPAIIAEFLDVIRQFGTPAAALVDLTNRRLNRLELAKRGLSGSVSFKKIRYAEIVASTWLEYSFGLSPLISDTEKAAEALARWKSQYTDPDLHKLRKKIMSRAVTTVATTSTGTFPLSPIASITPARSHIRNTTEHKVQYTVGLQGLLKTAAGSNDRLMQLLGFNHANWIPAIWEAVPWSWLVDYFSNVQEILNASVVNTSRVAWISKSETYSTRVEYSSIVSISGILDYYKNALGMLPSSLVLASGDFGQLTVVRNTTSRTVPITLGVPPLSLEHPFGDAKKIANMVAVLFKRKGNSALWIT